ncbi:hypothetical protein FB566_0417 [Stackebrandtia endophytica]|uniref:Uncharacterized protein n=1 Tax=Stackebrandtia endophytica TaxID=1496996 RepID=A0A543AQQ8_9ACTN|nr:hypothetical protein [Stackebrandtia endophytica]TQL74927.1 hypothetical protein FB566_0417 [Stackebrandtia endophytica]
MHLTTADIAYLKKRAANRQRMSMVVPIIIVTDVVFAVVTFFLLDPPMNLIVPIVLVAAGIASSLVLRQAIVRRGGDPQAILDGRDPVAWLDLVALGDQGNAPFPWSFEIPSRPGEYLHASESDDYDWRFEAGQRYRVYGFGSEDQPFIGVVYFTRTHDGGRYWDDGVRLSSQKWNTDVAV